jgi:hypothetical protein
MREARAKERNKINTRLQIKYNLLTFQIPPVSNGVVVTVTSQTHCASILKSL